MDIAGIGLDFGRSRRGNHRRADSNGPAATTSSLAPIDDYLDGSADEQVDSAERLRRLVPLRLLDELLTN